MQCIPSDAFHMKAANDDRLKKRRVDLIDTYGQPFLSALPPDTQAKTVGNGKRREHNRQKRREQNQEAKQKQSILEWHFTSVSDDGGSRGIFEDQTQRLCRMQPFVELSLQCALGFGGQPALDRLFPGELR